MPRRERSGPFRDGVGQCLTCGGKCDPRSKVCRDCRSNRASQVCPGCLVEKERAEFRTPKGNRRTYCTPCERNWHRQRRYFVKYGVTMDQYEALLAEQGGGCAICGSPTSGSEVRPHLAIDHDHETGAAQCRCRIPTKQRCELMQYDVDHSGDHWPVLGGRGIPRVQVERDGHGGYNVTAGADGFPVAVHVRPVGTLEIPPETLKLLGGPFSPEYVDDLLHALEQARRIAES